MPAPDDGVIARRRQELGVPEDWTWVSCSNECGDIVFVPNIPELLDAPEGARVAAVCSTECALGMFQKRL